MEDKIVIFKNDDKIFTLIPCTSCGMTIDEIAKKDVPMGVKYKIVNRGFDIKKWDLSDYDGVGTLSEDSD